MLNRFEEYCRHHDSPSLVEFLHSLDSSVDFQTLELLVRHDLERRATLHNSVQPAHPIEPTDYIALDDRTRSIVESFLQNNDRTIAPGQSSNDALTIPPNSDKSKPGMPADSSSQPSFGHYELIEELARGGMGVVYRARDTKLNRIVALKMVISGRLASEEERLRFNLEAEAAAKLDHPSITPIYEVGEIEGQQYFAMKFVEGGSLDDILDKLKTNPRKAARIVADIAHGIHHAHQRGTLHRDLKPQNILMDVDDKPMITDFGLAKLADSDSNMTQTGAVMGTPGYMPPEQALGDKNVTTAADIYSLGAILYATLTGQPPFQAGSAMETVLQVIDGEAAKPTSINSTVPFDLELVALKCLERDPAKRYATADELTQDLRHWLAGEPVSVRPPSVTSLASQWLKRNIRMAALSLLSGALIAALAVPLCLIGFQQSGLPGDIYDQLPQTERPIFAGWDFGLPERLGDGVKFLLIMVAIMLVSSAGAISVAWLKPRTMNESVGIGIMCGISVAITLFLLFFGWMVGGNATNNYISADVALLAEAGSSDSAARAMALKKIAWRYPDLANKNEQELIQFLQNKINSDTVLMAGLGNLLAATVSLMFLIPVVFSAAFYFRLLERSSSLVKRLLGHLEFVLIAMMMSLAMVWVLVTIILDWLPMGVMNGPKPSVLSLCLCTVVLAFAMWTIWRVSSMPMRLIVNAVAIGLFALVASSVFQAGSLDSDVVALLESEDFRGAAKRFDTQTYQGGTWYGSSASSVVLAAYADERELHDQLRTKFIESMRRREASYFPGSMAYYLESMLLTPISNDEIANLERMIEFVETFSTEASNGTHFHFVLALAEYRRGNLDLSLEHLGQVPVEPKERYGSSDTQPTSNLLDDQKTFVLRSIIYRQQGKVKLADDEWKRFEVANEFLSSQWFPKYRTSGAGAKSFTPLVHAYYSLQVLAREAKQ
ncbi:MAG: serine/threonine-protein kinase [Planctomycetota bacterium]